MSSAKDIHKSTAEPVNGREKASKQAIEAASIEFLDKGSNF